MCLKVHRVNVLSAWVKTSLSLARMPYLNRLLPLESKIRTSWLDIFRQTWWKPENFNFKSLSTLASNCYPVSRAKALMRFLTSCHWLEASDPAWRQKGLIGGRLSAYMGLGWREGRSALLASWCAEKSVRRLYRTTAYPMHCWIQPGRNLRGYSTVAALLHWAQLLRGEKRMRHAWPRISLATTGILASGLTPFQGSTKRCQDFLHYFSKLKQ